MTVPLPRQGPTTHVSLLATAGHAIQYINAFDLKNALQASTDLRHDLGDTMEEHFPVLLDRKMEDCTNWFLDNLHTTGIQEPLIVIIMPDGTWQMDEGHHRLAWALLHDLDVPVFFDDSGAGEQSIAAFTLARHNIIETHDMTEAIILNAADRLVDETDEFLSVHVEVSPDTGQINLIPKPRESARHRAGGRHRAY